MSVKNSDNSSNYDKANKSIGIRITKTPIFFYRNGKQAFVPLEESIIDQLRLTRNDLFVQEVQGGDIVLRRFKDI